MEFSLVTHTHWDREWYVPFEFYRHRLLFLIDSLIDRLHQQPEFKAYVLDGQTIVLEDYLEMRPERKNELVQLLKDGRLSAGPWYILPDEFLVSGESMIRNCLIGRQVLERLGCRSMETAYLPDMFGHSAYMPTLIKGLGLKAAVIWRGVGKAAGKTEFWWQAPNGDRVLTTHLMRGYSTSAHYGRPLDVMKEVIRDEVDDLIDKAATPYGLLMNGTDHEIFDGELVAQIPLWLEEWGHHGVSSTLDYYIERVLTAVDSISQIEGELRCPRREFVLKDILSSRVYLKLRHFDAQTFLSDYLEPLCACSRLTGTPAYLLELERSWRLVLQSQPHDTLCGCSTDRVHLDAESRLATAQENGIMSIARHLRMTASNIAESTTARDALVFNPGGFPLKTVVECYFLLDHAGYTIYDQETRIPTYIEPCEVGMEELLDRTCQPGRGSEQLAALPLLDPFIRQSSLQQLCEGRSGQWYRLLFPLDMPALGFKSVSLRKEIHSFTQGVPGYQYENPFYFFNLADDGSFEVKAKDDSVKTYYYLHFIDQADVGDGYNFAPLFGDREVNVKPFLTARQVINLNFMHEITLDGYLLLPRKVENGRRSSELIENPLSIRYRLFAFQRRIEVRISLENRSEDHRLRATFRFPERHDEVFNNSHFGLVRHPVEAQPDPEATEELVARYAMESFMGFSGENGIWMLMSRGNHEYETALCADATEVKLTLLRANGYLSRGDLSTRSGHAGPFVPTPGGQTKERLTYHLALDWVAEQEGLWPSAEAFLRTSVCLPGFRLNIPWQLFESLEGLHWMACKPAIDSDALIVRLLNPGAAREVVLRSRQFSRLSLTDMAEQNSTGVKGESPWRIAFKAGEVKTLRLEP